MSEAAVNGMGNVRKKKRWKKIVKRIIITLIVLILLAVAGMVIWSKLQADLTVTYDSYTASVGTISNSMSFSGTFALVNSETLTAASAGTVRTLYVKEGDSVKKDDKIARLSNGETLKAGVTGTVNVLSVAEGDSVAAGAEIAQIADFDHQSVSIRVDEYDIASVSVGQACNVTVTATEETFPAVIEHINYISSSTGSVAYYTATATVEVTPGIYPGMQVTVTIPEEEAADVVVLKMDALSFDNNNSAYVYTMNEDETLNQQYVEVGINNGNYVEIVSGLSSGDTVYVEAATQETTATNLLSLLGVGQRNTYNRTNTGTTRDWNNYDPSTMGGGGTNMGGGSGMPSRPVQ